MASEGEGKPGVDSAPTRLPWYSFLYRLLGAQGTFWLWIVCVGAVWWTLKPALVRLGNRRPHTIAIQDVHHQATRRMTRWVKLDGVEVTVDGALLRRHEAVLPPVPILLDPESRAGGWWLDTLRYAERVRADRDGVAPVTTAVDLPTAILELTERMAKLEAGDAGGLPLPDRAVLVQDERLKHGWSSASPRKSSKEPAVPHPAANAFIADREAYVDLVLERVRPDVALEGVLEWTPAVVQRRLADELDFPVTSYLLQANREPRDWESVVCATSLILLIFLGAGLIGATRVRHAEEPHLTPELAAAETAPEGSA